MISIFPKQAYFLDFAATIVQSLATCRGPDTTKTRTIAYIVYDVHGRLSEETSLSSELALNINRKTRHYSPILDPNY
nr:unnamed protein product [Spirometra erinaceieuropaei]